MLATGNTGVGFNLNISNRVSAANVVSKANSFGVAIQGNSSNNIVNGGVLSGNTTAVSNTATGTGNVIRGLTGYNPVGAPAAATMGASPFTVTAGASPETHYLLQSPANNATCTQGGRQIAVLGLSAFYSMIHLEPGESYTCTWATTAPTLVRVIH